jgi:hypothetical protein
MSYNPMGNGAMFTSPSFPTSVNLQSAGLGMLGGGGGIPANHPSLYASLIGKSPLQSAGGSFMNTGTTPVNQQTNNTVTMSRRLETNGKGLDRAKADLDYMAPFVQRTAELNPIKVNRMASISHTLLHDHASDCKSYGAMNAYLISEAGRRRFGKDVSDKNLLAEFFPGGFNMTELNTPNVSGPATEMVITTAVQGRVRTGNIWLCYAKHPPGIGNYLYVITKRFKISDAVIAKARFNSSTGGGGGGSYETKQESSAMDEENDNLLAAPKSKAARSASTPDHFWQFVPYFCHHGDTPATCLVFQKDVSEGSSSYVGYISAPHDRDIDMTSQSELARKVAMPMMDDSLERTSSYARLSQIDVMLGFGKG